MGRIAAPALVELAGNFRDVSGWKVPCAAFDACLYAAGILGWERVGPRPALPVKINRLCWGRLPSPGEACEVHVRVLEHHADGIIYDFTLYGIDGDLLLNASGYEVAWLGTDSIAV